MFDQTFVDGAGKTGKGWALTLSFIGEFAAIGVMILVPLIWTEVLPGEQSINSLTAPAPPPPAPPPPAAAPIVRHLRVAPHAFNPHMLEAPHGAPPHVAMITEDLSLPPVNLGEREGGIPGAALTGTSSVFSGGIATSRPPPSPALPKADVKSEPEKPLRVGGNVQSAKLLKHPAPVYPAIAKSARIQGRVLLQAIIGKDGTVQNLKVVSAASPLLVPPAMDAVKQWVYQPTLLNQEPVEVITEITVIFALQ